MREESEIFSDLEQLCASNGYAHAIAYFCLRDNTFFYSEKNGILPSLSKSPVNRLTCTEISILIGLMVKQKLNISVPSVDTLSKYIDDSEKLLGELHQSMLNPFEINELYKYSKNEILTRGKVLKEAILYSGESAFPFQYHELSVNMYTKDNVWLIENKGYTIEDANKVVKTIINHQTKQLNSILEKIGQEGFGAILPAYIFSINDIVDESKLDKVIVSKVISSFSLSSTSSNVGFKEPSEFNETNAWPIIPIDKLNYLLFQNNILLQSLYESPFHWYKDDSNYLENANKNRGLFVEEYCAKRLKHVFGDRNVFSGVKVKKTKNSTATDIDVLVKYADRVIIVQCKSKKLTITARKGNDEILRDDFKKAIQDAYEQGEKCANCILDGKHKFYTDSNEEIKISPPKEIYIFCVVSSHYPSLAFQAKQFLKFKSTDIIMPPYVMDIFFLDVLTEMLQTPLYFLSYINRRTNYIETINTSHELVTLFYHLKRNLWFENGADLVYLLDHDCVEIYEALLTRRENFEGKDTPEGILTAFKGTPFDKIIKQIEALEEPDAINLGFMLLRCGSDFVSSLNKDIRKICNLNYKDGKLRYLSFMLEPGQVGLTIHININSPSVAEIKLAEYCNKVKYIEKANRWFGLCLDLNLNIQRAITLENEWHYSTEMETLVKPVLERRKKKGSISKGKRRKKNKIGRNAPCPCGSGKKYKKCCLRY